MPRFGYIISGHGLGHAARCIALMQRFEEFTECNHSVISSAPQWLFSQSGIRSVRFLPENPDPGLVQVSETELCAKQSVRTVAEYQEKALSLAARYAVFLKEADAIICDCAAIGVLVAQKLKCPSILVENFRWDWIYDKMSQHGYPEFQSLSSWCKRLYSETDLHIQTEPICARSNGAHHFGPIARRPLHSRAETESLLGLDTSKMKVLLSIRVQEAELLERLAAEYPAFQWIVPGSSSLEKQSDAIFHVPSTFCHPSLMSVSDCVITRLGAGVLSEALAANTSMLYLSREWFPESAILESYLQDRLTAARIESLSYQCISDAFNSLLIHKSKFPREHEPASAKCAQFILSFLASTHSLHSA